MLLFTPPIAVTYGLLLLAVAALWLRPLPAGPRLAIPPWLLLFAAACVAGLGAGYLKPAGLASIGAFGTLAALAAAAERQGKRLQQTLLMVAVAVMTLALSMHRLPGFDNPVIVSGLIIGDAAIPVTQRLNFDTIAAGLILFSAFCRPARGAAEVRQIYRATAIILGTPVVVLAVALAAGYVAVDFKLLAYTPVFLLANLFFTCVTEEAFFRGLIQTRLATAMSAGRDVRKAGKTGQLLAIAIAALLFGLAHARGGPVLIGLAALAGLGYGYSYYRSGRIEAAILTHFALNALHFIAFTYPGKL
jgi:membrane protease YdiL (CAAX protease family)